MRDRQERLKAIKRIIRAERIDSQERLLQFLDREGFHVTQATLSRDLKLLRVGKQPTGSEGYFYSLPSEEERRERDRSYVEDFVRGYVSLDASGQLAVIRTLDGHASSVAIAIDHLGFAEVLGTVAGDDTVMVALRDNSTVGGFRASLQERIPEWEP